MQECISNRWITVYALMSDNTPVSMWYSAIDPLANDGVCVCVKEGLGYYNYNNVLTMGNLDSLRV